MLDEIDSYELWSNADFRQMDTPPKKIACTIIGNNSMNYIFLIGLLWIYINKR